MGATLAALTATRLLRTIPHFDPTLSRLRDALGLIALGAFASAMVSSVIGVLSLYATGHEAYSSLPSAWSIYWLGDATGVLLVTPLVFTVPRLVRTLTFARALELVALLVLMTLTCVAVFGDWPPIAGHLHVLAFVVLPFVMWGAIKFGIAGAAVSVFWTAAIATVLTALGHGPFAGNTTFVMAVMLDVFFAALSLSGLTLAAVIVERDRAQSLQVRQALSDVNRRLITAQEEERKRIARELHDDISQRLALLAVDLGDQRTVVPGKAARLCADAVQIATDVQALSHRLHSSKVELLGLAKSARLLCADVATQQKISVLFEDRDVPNVSSATALCVYRILQEALHNVAAHSRATSCRVQLFGASNEVHLIVEDGGAGFDAQEVYAGPGIGLISMQERAALVGGQVSIVSARGRGTTIHARVPAHTA
jgi:signal transduction histidine kinase